MDEHDRDFGQPDAGSDTEPDMRPDTGRPDAAWAGFRRVAAPRAEPQVGVDPGRGGAGRDPHGLEPDHAMPSWRARRDGPGSDLGRMGKVAGGLALALLAVAGGWSMLGRRPHEIPVIEAPAGPLRVRPENPGGMQLASGVDTTPEGTGTLAPPPEVPQPGALRAQIQAGATVAGLAAGAAAVPAGVVAQADQATQGQTTQGQATHAQTAQGRTETSAVSPPGVAVPGMAVPGVAPDLPLAAPRVAAAVPGVRVAASSTQPGQPGPVVGTTTPGPAAAGAQPAAADARPAAAPAAGTQGGAMVQLAALDSEQGATTEWQRLQHRMPELLGSRRPEVQRAAHDGHPIWRLRTGGFATMAQAAEFCIQVRARGTGCSIAAF